MKLFDCIPHDIALPLRRITDMRELRIRNDSVIKVNVSGRWYYLSENGGLVSSSHKAMIAAKICDDIVKRACANSVYAYEKSLANGFFTLEDGVRVGVCGQMFGTERKVFQRYTSLCFRIPHYVNCVSEKALMRCANNNTVVIGAPASGKTTYLRDVAVKLATQYNVLVADERGEIFYDESLLGTSGCDVLKWSDKAYAFDVGIRAMSPQYFVCDELTESDVPFVKSCVASGVKLVCSAHAFNSEDFDKRFGLLNEFGNIVNLNH